jgi:surface protein
MSSNFELYKEIPNDQYSCPKCDLVPEIKGIDCSNGIIEIICPYHGEITMQIDEYFHSELPYLYYSFECYFSKLKQSDYIKDNIIFSKCLQCDNKIFCHSCLKEHGHHKKKIKTNEINNICHTHLKNNDKYCVKCRKHFCKEEKCIEKCKHKPVQIGHADNKDIEKIKNKKKLLIKNKELLEYSIKLLDTVIETYEKHPTNYYNTLNIKNVANNIKDGDNNLNAKIIAKLNNIQQRILNYVNVKLNVTINGNETHLYLQNKNIDDSLLGLLTLIKFENLQELDLSHNGIKNPAILQSLDAKNLRKLDLSFNAINDIKSVKELIINKIFSQIREINLQNNKVTNKEIEEVKALLEKEEYIKECKMNYALKKTERKLRIFGENFVEKNKDFCKMQIEDEKEKKEIKSELDYKEIKEEIKKKGSINIRLFLNNRIEDMSGLFSECNTLKKIDNIFYLDSSNTKEMKDMFNGCSSLASIPEDISLWETSHITDMSGLFFGCLSLKYLPDISKWKTTQLTDVTSIFRGCSHLESLPDLSQWDTSKITKMRCMFYECSSLTALPDLSKWNVSNVIDMRNMFYKCSSLKDVSCLSNWDTSKVTSMKCMFKGCSSLSSKPKIQVNKNNSTDVSEMFDFK